MVFLNLLNLNLTKQNDNKVLLLLKLVLLIQSIIIVITIIITIICIIINIIIVIGWCSQSTGSSGSSIYGSTAFGSEQTNSASASPASPASASPSYPTSFGVTEPVTYYIPDESGIFTPSSGSEYAPGITTQTGFSTSHYSSGVSEVPGAVQPSKPTMGKKNCCLYNDRFFKMRSFIYEISRCIWLYIFHF